MGSLFINNTVSGRFGPFGMVNDEMGDFLFYWKDGSGIRCKDHPSFSQLHPGLTLCCKLAWNPKLRFRPSGHA